MSRASRKKGSGAEYELRDLLIGYGFDGCYRVERSGGGREKGDLGGVPGFHLEVKRHEDLDWWKAFRQARKDCPPGDVPVVIARRSKARGRQRAGDRRGHWVIAMPAGSQDLAGLRLHTTAKGSRNLHDALLDWNDADVPGEPAIVAADPAGPNWVLRYLEPAGHLALARSRQLHA